MNRYKIEQPALLQIEVWAQNHEEARKLVDTVFLQPCPMLFAGRSPTELDIVATGRIVDALPKDAARFVRKYESRKDA